MYVTVFAASTALSIVFTTDSGMTLTPPTTVSRSSLLTSFIPEPITGAPPPIPDPIPLANFSYHGVRWYTSAVTTPRSRSNTAPGSGSHIWYSSLNHIKKMKSSSSILSMSTGSSIVAGHTGSPVISKFTTPSNAETLLASSTATGGAISAAVGALP